MQRFSSLVTCSVVKNVVTPLHCHGWLPMLTRADSEALWASSNTLVSPIQSPTRKSTPNGTHSPKHWKYSAYRLAVSAAAAAALDRNFNICATDGKGGREVEGERIRGSLNWKSFFTVPSISAPVAPPSFRIKTKPRRRGDGWASLETAGTPLSSPGLSKRLPL